MGLKNLRTQAAKERAVRDLRTASLAQGRAKTRLTYIYPKVYRALFEEEKAKIKQAERVDHE